MTLELHDVNIHRESETLIESLYLSVNAGEIYTIMGPSGCGKSTLLSYIAGTMSPEFSGNGDVRLHDHSLAAVPVERRRIGILFQDPLLFPHMTLLQNLMFAASATDSKARRTLAMAALKEVGLSGRENGFPNQLSGGQAARVSLMRTLLAEPRAMLLDEPFSKLDLDTRQQFRSQVYDIIRQRNIPTIIVSHDPADIADHGQVIQLHQRER